MTDTHPDFARAADLEAAYVAANEDLLADRDNPVKRAAFRDAAAALQASVTYWKQIGEAVDFGHPGKRIGNMPRVENYKEG